MTHIIKHTVNWREEDYDGYNDYFVNPEYMPSNKYYKGHDKQEQEDEEWMFNHIIYKEYDQKNLLLLQAQGAIGDVRISAICKLSYELQR